MMYSILPGLSATVFLISAIIVWFKFKRHYPAHFALFILFITTFFWQGSWTILFQTKSPETADILIQFGWLLILFLPTSIYHFLSEVCKRRDERHYIFSSYAFSVVLAFFLLSSDLFINGHYHYFFGYYPKAGPMHSLHLIQTSLVIMRGLWITHQTLKQSEGIYKEQLNFVFIASFVYSLAAVDYLCNYGFEFYPPGIFFIMTSLGVYAFAIYKKELISNIQKTMEAEHDKKLKIIRASAGNLAHELRTPLATIRLDTLSAQKDAPLAQHENIIRTLDRINMSIDLLLTNACGTDLKHNLEVDSHSIASQIENAIKNYPFTQKPQIDFNPEKDFNFTGSNILLRFVLYNLINNALYYIEKAMKGKIIINTFCNGKHNIVSFKDTSTGIEKDKINYIFDDFYSTKPNGAGNGLGLGFCKKAMAAVGGDITVDSIFGEYTEFILLFPVNKEATT